MYRTKFTVIGFMTERPDGGGRKSPQETVVDIVEADDAVRAAFQVMARRGEEYNFVAGLAGPVEVEGTLENLPSPGRGFRLPRDGGEPATFTLIGYELPVGISKRNIVRRPTWPQAVEAYYEIVRREFGANVEPTDIYRFLVAIRGMVDLELRVEHMRDAFGEDFARQARQGEPRRVMS